MTAYLLAVDGGSQSTKVSVIDQTGTVHATGRAALRPYELGPDGYAVHPGDDLWESLVVAIREALDAFAGTPADITAVGLCSIRYCRALLDGHGRLTEPVLSWMDARVGRPLSDVSPSVATVASAAGYLTMRLTGARRDSAATYQGMWPIDRVTRDWSGDPAQEQRTGMPRRLLPDLVDPGERLGSVTTQAAVATGLLEGCPVHATANDKAVEALGAGLLEPSAVLLSLGTYIASMTPGLDPGVGDERVWVNDAAVPGRYLYESGGIRRGMSTVSWVRDLVGSAATGLDPEATQAWLEAGAALLPPGSEGLVTVPDWLAPPDAPHRRGAILGLAGRHGPHHLYRSVLEAIALTMHGHAEAMAQALWTRYPEVIVSGGGARSDLMMQIVADSWGRPAIRAGMPDAAGLGAAICAAVGSGVHPDWQSAVAAMVRRGRTFVPEAEAQQGYVEVAAVFRDLPSFTDPMFCRMADGQD